MINFIFILFFMYIINRGEYVLSKACCLDCEKRYLGCHSNCSDYKQYKEKLAFIKEQKEIAKQRYQRVNNKRCFKKIKGG